MESHEFARVSEKGVKNQGGVITLNLLLIHDQNTYFFFISMTFISIYRLRFGDFLNIS